MEIVFTTNEKFWSRVFRYMVGEPASHMCLRFNIEGFDFSVDCSTSGGRLMPWDNFSDSNRSISKVVFDYDDELEKILFEKALYVVGKSCDMGAYRYGLWRAILKKFFHVPYPKINLGSDPKKFACTEIIVPIQEVIESEFGISFSNLDLSAMSPWMIYQKISSEAANGI